MSTKTYAKRHPRASRFWIGALAGGAGRLELVVLALTVLAGILIGILLESFLLGFAALAALAAAVRLILELLDSGRRGGHGGHGGPVAAATGGHRREDVRS